MHKEKAEVLVLQIVMQTPENFIFLQNMIFTSIKLLVLKWSSSNLNSQERSVRLSLTAYPVDLQISLYILDLLKNKLKHKVN